MPAPGEGLSQGRFDARCSPGFVGHGADGMVELNGFIVALPDRKVAVDSTLAEVLEMRTGHRRGSTQALLASGWPMGTLPRD